MDVFDLYATISIKLDDFEKGLDQAKSKAESFAKNISGLSSSIDKAYSGVKDVLQPAVDGFKAVEGVGQKAGSAIKKGLTGFAAASTAVAGFGTAAVNSGMKFDATMSEVAAISGKVADEDLPGIIKKAQEMGISFKDTGDATSTVMDILRNKALQMGATTKFSASEAGEAMTYMSMAGWKAGDMIGGIEGIMNLAAASGEDLATTSDIVTDALTAFGLQASDSGHFADVLAAASSNANTNVSMMGDTFKYVAPIAGAMGYSAEDTALAIGLMANSSIKGSQAGTSLRSVLTRMAKPTKESGAAMDALGVSITNSDGSMKSLGEVITDLRSSFSGLTETEQTTYAAMLAGQEAMSGLLAIVTAAPEDVEKLTDALNDCDGAAKEMSKIKMDNLAGDIDYLKSAFESLQIAISDSLTPTLREFAQFGQKAMAELLEGFQGGGMFGFALALSNVVSEGITMISGKAPDFVWASTNIIMAFANGILDGKDQIISAGTEIVDYLFSVFDEWLYNSGPDLVEFGTDIINLVFDGFSQAGEVISDHIGAFIPLIAEAFLSYHEALFTIGIDILGAIGQGIIDNKEELQSIASDTITNMVTALRDNAPAIIEGGLALLEALVGAIEENLPLIIETGAVIIGKLIEGITTASPGVQAIIATAVLPHILKIIDTVGQIGGVFGKVVELVTGESGIGKILGIGKTLMGGISKLWALLMSNPITQVITIVGLLVAAFVTLWNNCEAFRNFWIGLWEGIKSIASAAVDGIKAAFDGIVDFFSGVVDGIKGAFEGIGEFLGGLFTAAWELVQGAWDAAKGFFSEIADGIRAVFETVTSFLGEAFSAAWDLISTVWNAAVGFFTAIWDGIRTAAETAAGAVGDVLSAAWDAITSVWDGAVEFFGGIWDGIKGVFSDVWEHFLDIGGNIVNGIREGIAGAWDAFMGWLDGKVGGIVNGVKSMLGIHSPSTVFAGIGENMALGLAEGWDDQYTSIKRQIENGMSFGTATVGLAANGTYNPSGAARNSDSSGFGGGSNVTVNIYNPEKRDAVTEAREWKKTAQRMAMGYV